MSPEFKLAAFMLFALAGLCIYARVEAWWRERKRKQQEREQLERDLNAALDARDRRTDKTILNGLELLALLNDTLVPRDQHIPPRAFDAQLVERSGGRPLHWERLPEDETGGAA